MNKPRHTLSTLIIAIISAMTAGTFVEMRHGNDYALSHVYGSWWFVTLWALLAAGIIVMMFFRKSWKRPVVCALHGSVLLILLGALLTMLTGQHGEMTLNPSVPTNQFTIEKHGESRTEVLPFSLTLDRFEVETYPGTCTPMDFVSHLQIQDGATTTDAKISMNHILKYRHYRFYQSDYDKEGNSVLSVAHDPWGVGVTYAGYLLLLIALIGLFFEREGQFRTLLQKISTKTASLAILLILCAFLPTQAANKPTVLPKESADKMGQMYVMYKGRVCPLQTLAKDFTTKLYGNARYHGYTPEQVFSGWLFYTDDWQNEPIPRIERDLKRGKQRGAEEKSQIINMLLNSQLLKIFPHADSAQQVTWYSRNDQLPLEISDDEYLFIRKQLSLCQEYAMMGNFDALNEVFEKTKIYQEKYSLGQVQSKTQYRAERLYNKLTVGHWLAMVTITLGLLCFAAALICLGKNRKLYKPVRMTAVVWMSLLCVFLALVFILRWIAGGHVPMAGSFDSMNLLALSICAITLIITKVETRHGTSLQNHETTAETRHGTSLQNHQITVETRRAASLQNTGNIYEIALPSGLLMTGFVLLVQMMGGSNPPITHLMPVLTSPLLSLHVTVIIIAYALLFFIMLNGISSMIVRFTQPSNTAYLERLRDISMLMLYPAIALLAAGIFIGAIWANISWGNYWSWDPKEVWALITLIIYIIPLHSTVWKSFRNPMFFHLYCILAFLSVLITYFGVNLLLGGMHSYA